MIAPPSFMFVQQSVDVVRVEVATLACALLRQCLPHAVAQLVVDQLLQWKTKTLLGSVQNLSGYQVANGVLEDQLCFQTFHFERCWYARDELNQLMVKEWRARFQRNGHAHAINFHKDISR